MISDAATDQLVRQTCGLLKRVGVPALLEAFALTFVQMHEQMLADADAAATTGDLPDESVTAISHEAIRETSKRLCASLGVGTLRHSVLPVFTEVIDHCFAGTTGGGDATALAQALLDVPRRLPLLDCALSPFVSRAQVADLGAALKQLRGQF